jgi:hypothetical protein
MAAQFTMYHYKNKLIYKGFIRCLVGLYFSLLELAWWKNNVSLISMHYTYHTIFRKYQNVLYFFLVYLWMLPTLQIIFHHDMMISELERA